MGVEDNGNRDLATMLGSCILIDRRLFQRESEFGVKKVIHLALVCF